jgi:hypothetical protein
MTGGDSGGYIDEGDRIAYFSCHDGKLTEFHRLPLPQGQWVVRPLVPLLPKLVSGGPGWIRTSDPSDVNRVL